MDLVSPDQHWKWTQWLGPALCHTAFFKVKCINLVFTNYLLVYLQVSVFRGDSKSFFVSYMKPYRANHKAGSLLRDFPWIWWQSSSLNIRWDPQSGPAALAHSNVRNLYLDQVCHLYGPVVFGEGLWTLYVVWFFTYIACIVRLISCNKLLYSVRLQ